MEKRNVFDNINPFNYHSELFMNFRRLAKDGLCAKDNDRAFGILGDMYVKHITKTGYMPDYNQVLDWVQIINN